MPIPWKLVPEAPIPPPAVRKEYILPLDGKDGSHAKVCSSYGILGFHVYLATDVYMSNSEEAIKHLEELYQQVIEAMGTLKILVTEE